MRFHFVIAFFLLFSLTVLAQLHVSFHDVVDIHALQSPHASSARLRYENAALTYENYRKGFLPTVQLSVSPTSFNHSMRLLQDPSTGEYRNVEDYANTSAASLTISQKVGPTGGTLSVMTGLSYLHEFTDSRDSYCSTPFSVSYSQQLFGGYRSYILDRNVNRLQHEFAATTLCSTLANEQREVAHLYITVCLALLQEEQARKEVEAGDTLLHYARLRREHGNITSYDLNQIRIEQLLALNTQTQATADAKEAIHMLIIRLGLPENELSVTMPDASTLPPLLTEVEIRTLARQHNPEYKSAELRQAQAAKNLHTRKLATRFNASISLNYGLNQYAHTFCAAYNHPNQQQSVGVTLSIPVFDWGTSRNRRRMAENDYEEEEISIEEAVRKADQEIITQTANYNLASSKYHISREQYTLAMEQYRLLVNRFSQGSASVYELISANRSKQEAMLSHMNVIKTLFDEYYSIRQFALYDFCADKPLWEVYGIGKKK